MNDLGIGIVIMPTDSLLAILALVGPVRRTSLTETAMELRAGIENGGKGFQTRRVGTTALTRSCGAAGGVRQQHRQDVKI